MIDRLINWCTANPLRVVAASIALAAWGLWAMQRLPLDAVPDVADVQVIVATEWPGRSPDLVEDQITYPLVSALSGAPRVRTVRAVTDLGISHVYVLFEDRTDLYWARSRVLEAVQNARSSLPDGVAPTLAPDATSVGWIYEYALVDSSGRHSLDELRSLQDWKVRHALAGVRGVAEVASIGGYVKQYQVNLDPARLYGLSLSPKQVVDAVRASNGDVEGRLLEFAGREYAVRARGTLSSLEDLKQVAIATTADAVPIRLTDVADVRIGPDLRRGIADLDGRGEVVGGIVIMRAGENALAVIDRVVDRLASIQRTLPDGVELIPVYDRSHLIRDAMATLRWILVEEMFVVSLVVAAFLFHFRSALIPVVTLPIAVVCSFLPLWSLGVTSNIMSLGGIALAIGVLVDAAIVMVENGDRRLAESPDARGAERSAIAARAALQVGRAVFYCLAIIAVSFLPVLLLEGEEGRMFRPLAFTKSFGVAASSLLSITLVPALMVLLVRGSHRPAHPVGPLMRLCASQYERVLRLALRRRWLFLAVNAAIVPATALLVPAVGSEFVPPLYEGSLLYMPSAPPGLAITEATRLLQTQDRVLREFPEVERVFGTAGRATSATDNSPLGMANTIVTLKPRSQWRPGVTFESLQREMDEALQIPGFPNFWTQPIRGRLDMLATGIRTPLGIKVLGSDLAVIHAIGSEIERVLRTLPETRSAVVERVADGYFVDVQIDRAAIGRHGLSVQDVEDVIQSAIGGINVGYTVEGRERYPISVRYQQDYRADLPSLERVRVKTPSGAQVALGALAKIALQTGPAMIRDENGLLAGYVYVDAAAPDMAGYVARAREAVERQVALPPGYVLEWSGQYESQLRASSHLRAILPLACLAIFALLVLVFRSASEASIVMLSVPYAMTGGLVLQWLLGYRFSVAVWVGYIALFGVAVQTGVIMVIYLHEALDRRTRADGSLTEADVHEATVSGAVSRLRPKLMTVMTTILGLLPLLWSRGVGSDVLEPMAAPIVGGMITSAVHVLIITPVIFYLIASRRIASARQPATAALVAGE
jgi:Cu(I)/Ag(I) efflux system membrane protein CusA/SilA